MSSGTTSGTTSESTSGPTSESTPAARVDSSIDEDVAARTRPRRWWSSPTFSAALGLLALVVVFGVLAPGRFPTLGNAYTLLGDAGILLIVAMPTTFVLVLGQLDLSSGSVLALTEVIAVKTMVAIGGDGPAAILLGLVAGVGVGVAWGFAQGVLIARAGIPSFVVTLAGFGAALGVAYLLTGGQDIASVPPALVYGVGVGSVIGLPVVFVIAAAFVVLAAWTLRGTRFGRHTFAVGSDAVASERAGIDVTRHTITVFTMAGGYYGIAGFLSLARFSTTTVSGHDQDALNAIASVALGGTSLFGGLGSAVGSALGVFIPTVLQNGLVIVSVQPYWQMIAVAVALLLAVYADRLRRRTRRR